MSATCPGCGVTVVAGYVKCPKCQKVLPQKRRIDTVAGGTVSESKPFPRLPLMIAGVGVLAVVGFVVMRSGGGGTTASVGDAAVTDEPSVEQPIDDPRPSDLDPQPDEAPPGPNRINPNAVAADVGRALTRQRLWSTVEASGRSLIVRSASCGDAQLMPIIDAAAPALRQAGLTKVRCLEQSGAVAFERDL